MDTTEPTPTYHPISYNTDGHPERVTTVDLSHLRDDGDGFERYAAVNVVLPDGRQLVVGVMHLGDHYCADVVAVAPGATRVGRYGDPEPRERLGVVTMDGGRGYRHPGTGHAVKAGGHAAVELVTLLLDVDGPAQPEDGAR